MMNWNNLEQIDQLVDIDVESHTMPVVLFKHSTRCSISSAALDRVERGWNDQEMEGIRPYYLDLIAHRSISDAIAIHYQVEHQSPQVLVIKDGECVYHESHMGISYREIREQSHR